MARAWPMIGRRLADDDVALTNQAGGIVTAGKGDLTVIRSRRPAASRPVHIDKEPFCAWACVIGQINYEIPVPTFSVWRLHAHADDVAVIGPDKIGPEIKAWAGAWQFLVLAFLCTMSCVPLRWVGAG